MVTATAATTSALLCLGPWQDLCGKRCYIDYLLQTGGLGRCLSGFAVLQTGVDEAAADPEDHGAGDSYAKIALSFCLCGIGLEKFEDELLRIFCKITGCCL